MAKLTTMTDKELFEIARKVGKKAAVGEMRKELAGRGYVVSRTIDALKEAVDKIGHPKRNRLRRRIAEHLGENAVVATINKMNRRHVHFNQKQKLAEKLRIRLLIRLANFKKARVEKIALELYRHGGAGGSYIHVSLTDNPAEVTYKVDKSKNYDTYKGRFKGWGATVDSHEITVPTNWKQRVMLRGLEDVDGMMTLDASPLDGAPEGVELFAATWAVQGRGYNTYAVTGYIARTTQEGEVYSYHGSTVPETLDGLRKKCGRLTLKQTERVATFVNRFAGLADKVQVSVGHARDVGACEFGIRSWCAAVGLSFERGGHHIG